MSENEVIPFKLKPNYEPANASNDDADARPEKLLSIANYLEDISSQSPCPHWIKGLAGEIRELARDFRNDD